MNTRKACVVSVLFHALLFAVIFTNWFKWSYKQTDLISPMPVEVETFADTSQSPTPLADSLKIAEPQKEEIIKEPPPTVEDSKPIEPIEPEPEIKDPLPEEVAKILEDVSDDPTPLPPVVEKKKPVIKEVKKEKVEKKITEKKVEKQKPMDAMSILKNLQQTAKSSGNSKSAPVLANSGQGGELSDQLTASELDRVRRQIESVWNVPGAIQNAHKIVVRIQITINQDRTVRSAKILNREQMNDVTFRTMAESALRAVSHFKERPLLLSPEKYTIWKELTINFDPRDLL